MRNCADLLSSEDLFFWARREKSIDFTLFILEGLRENWSQCLTNFVKENVEKERISNESFIAAG